MTLPLLQGPVIRLVIAFFAGLLFSGLFLAQGALAQDAYNLRAGDVLRIEVLEDPSLNRSVLVPPDGRLSLPFAGSLQASGRPVDQVQAELTTRLAPNFAAAPNVTVSIERIAEPRAAAAAAGPATIDIFVMGEVAKPGQLAVERGTTVMQLFAQMGGFSRFAATKRIQLRRVDGSGEEKIYPMNYDAMEQGASKVGRTVLKDGDIIVVPQRRLFE